jgi:alkylation response protein AidB-like acyl-CoA dehydrogenase
VRSELLRFLRYRMQTALSQGRTPGSEASVMKLAYGRYMKALTETAVAAQGASGMLTAAVVPAAAANGSGGANGSVDHADLAGWARRFLHAPSLRIAGGSDQVQANIIGERALGLPGEPRPDRTTPFRDLATRPPARTIG